jgi:hypothetical protein
MAEIVNLRIFAKKKQRLVKAAKAARNRAASGRTKLEQARAALENRTYVLDGKKLDRRRVTPVPSHGDDGDDGEGGAL